MDIEEYRTKHIAFLEIQANILKSIDGTLKMYVKAFQPKLTAAETESLRKLEREWEDDKDNSLKPSQHISGVNLETEEIFMDLTEVSIEAFTDKAILVTKKGYQKWVPRSVIDPQVDLSQLQKGQYYGIIPLHARGEKWFHDKKTWEVYKVL